MQQELGGLLSPYRPWLRRLFILLFILPSLGFLLGSAVLMTYTFWPVDFANTQRLAIDPGANHVVLIAHGLRDDTSTWALPLQQALRARQGKDSNIQALDWKPYSESTFRCSVAGRRIGRHLGQRLARSSALRSLHLITQLRRVRDLWSV